MPMDARQTAISTLENEPNAWIKSVEAIDNK
jgi:hypothetical protein